MSRLRYGVGSINHKLFRGEEIFDLDHTSTKLQSDTPAELLYKYFLSSGTDMLLILLMFLLLTFS